jgi:hypothetical protein
MPESAVKNNALSLRYQTPGTPLQRVLAEAPYFPRVSANKSAELSRPAEYAIRWPNMQINRRDFVSWLIFDCDHSDVYRWEKVGLPAPNMIVASRKNGVVMGYHAFYAITPVCTSKKARSHPIAYMKAIYEQMRRLLEADENYHGGPVCKTPGHPWWHTIEFHSYEYSLGELHEYIELPSTKPRFSKGPDLDSVGHSRTLTFFEQLRFFAYSIVSDARSTGTFEAFYSKVNAYGEQINDFARRGFIDLKTREPKGNLRQSETKAVVKSVARWTWDYYTGDSRCNRGVMQLPDDLPLREKQQLAAARTHTEKSSKTVERIRYACAQLMKAGEKVTQVAVGRLARLSRQTVAKYRAVLCDAAAARPADAPPVVETVAAANDVKFAAYKITGASQCTTGGCNVVTYGESFLDGQGTGIHQTDDGVDSS